MADVFVSYAHHNAASAEVISGNLEQAGFTLWWDKRLRAGDDFALAIERELRSAGCVVVAWSAAARNSLWVRAEATEALDAGKLVQIQLDAVRPPLPFTAVQMFDFTRWRGRRDEAPWASLESEARARVSGVIQPVDPRTFHGPALQDMGPTAALGWLSIGLIAFTGALTLQVGTPGFSPALYGMVVSANFAVACVAFGLTLVRIVRTAWASRS